MDKAGKSALKRVLKVFYIILALSLLIGVGIVTSLTRNGVSIIAVNGDSMNPTFSDKDTVVLIQESKVKKDQIAVVTKPKAWSDYALKSKMIKRIIAVPGDTFSFDGKVIKVNDEIVLDTVKEGYDCKAAEKDYSVVLNSKQYLIRGDNVTNSLDSLRIFCDGNSSKMFIEDKNIKSNGHVRYIL